MSDALVIGAGPAGLMAAEALANAGRQVIVAEAKPSVGRKLLMAGKSGLNLTKVEPFEDFCAAFDPAAPLRPMLEQFGPDQVQGWARGLDQPVFTGSTGRVFPKVMKASPLLRAWMTRLADLRVEVRMRWRWQGWEGEQPIFDTPVGQQVLRPKVTVLAMGGASWARLGSDGEWVRHLSGASITPFKPANSGFVVDWSPHMAKHFGKPVKAAALLVDGQTHRGEFVISERGLEGGGIYAISKQLREGASLHLDLLPDLTVDEVTARLSRPRGKTSMTNYLRKTLRLDPARIALLNEFARPLPEDAELTAALKNLPVPLKGPRPLDEAISVAGGIAWQALDQGLMLTSRPGTFCAGEMLDWEAPTGGYLLTGCLATGLWAGQHAALYA